MFEKMVADAAQTSVKLVESGLKKIWSVLDAAGERKAPGEVLSPKAIGAIQGKSPTG
jgi:hypothetical protein